MSDDDMPSAEWIALRCWRYLGEERYRKEFGDSVSSPARQRQARPSARQIQAQAAVPSPTRRALTREVLPYVHRPWWRFWARRK